MKLKLKGEEAKAYAVEYQGQIADAVKKHSQSFVDPSLMQLTVYRDIADELIKFGGKASDVEKIREYYRISDLVDRMQKQSDKKLLVAYKKDIDQLRDIGYKSAANVMLNYLMAFGKGDLAIDFVAKDINGRKMSLSSLKGKVIYVDLWASWCGPCMEEMPSYEKLKQQFSNRSDIAFVSLSIDDNEGLWKSSINSRKAEGYQWLINRAKLQAYNIVGIPRSLLIDKDFKVVDLAAPLPSNPKLVSLLNQLANPQ